MGLGHVLALSLILLCASAGDHAEHTPFHRRDPRTKEVVDVRDAQVRFSSTRTCLDSAVMLGANTSRINDATPVRIDWKNPGAGLFDMVALYTPPTRAIQDYLDYRFVFSPPTSS